MSDEKKDDGEPAFPFQYEGNQGPGTHVGMSLRDWFAGQALQGLLNSRPTTIVTDTGVWARTAYSLADAMLAARKQ